MNESIERDPFRLIWPCDPKHGLESMLKILARVREYEPRVNLTVFHTWESSGVWLWKRLAKLPQDGVALCDWPSESILESESRAANLWCCPSLSEFADGIPAAEMQRFGCIPIFRPTAGLSRLVNHGFPRPGDPRDPLVRARYAAIIRDLVGNPELCDEIRAGMAKEYQCS